MIVGIVFVKIILKVWKNFIVNMVRDVRIKIHGVGICYFILEGEGKREWRIEII
jgi:hypothetical protein